MNSLIVAFFVTTASTGAPPLPSLEQKLAGGAAMEAAVLTSDEQTPPADMIQPAVRTLDLAPATFDPAAAPIIA